MSNLQLFARIRSDSKYYRQGLLDPTNPKSPPACWRVDALFPDADLVYPVRMAGNRYRLEDVDFYMSCTDGKIRRLGKGGAQ